MRTTGAGGGVTRPLQATSRGQCGVKWGPGAGHWALGTLAQAGTLAGERWRFWSAYHHHTTTPPHRGLYLVSLNPWPAPHPGPGPAPTPASGDSEGSEDNMDTGP